MNRVNLLLRVNGVDYPVEVEQHRSLLEVLREDVGLTGTKPNCQEGECGACTVIVDDLAVNSCLLLAVRAQGRDITTIEGLSSPDGLHPVQQAFLLHGAFQCGYCTPGVILSAVALLTANPRPTEAELTRAMVGNICRCTGYVKIRSAMRTLAAVEDPA